MCVIRAQALPSVALKFLISKTRPVTFYESALDLPPTVKSKVTQVTVFPSAEQWPLGLSQAVPNPSPALSPSSIPTPWSLPSFYLPSSNP